jgi:PTS system mannose-specific IIA component
VSVGVLLLTHPGMAATLVGTAQRLLGNLPLAVEAVEVPFDADLELLSCDLAPTLRRLDEGGGVLVLTDLYGASPSNLGARCCERGIVVRRVSGLNLPMLLRVLNYPEQSLDELVTTAASGGRTGVVVDHA